MAETDRIPFIICPRCGQKNSFEQQECSSCRKTLRTVRYELRALLNTMDFPVHTAEPDEEFSSWREENRILYEEADRFHQTLLMAGFYTEDVTAAYRKLQEQQQSVRIAQMNLLREFFQEHFSKILSRDAGNPLNRRVLHLILENFKNNYSPVSADDYDVQFNMEEAVPYFYNIVLNAFLEALGECTKTERITFFMENHDLVLLLAAYPVETTHEQNAEYLCRLLSEGKLKQAEELLQASFNSPADKRRDSFFSMICRLAAQAEFPQEMKKEEVQRLLTGWAGKSLDAQELMEVLGQ